MNENQILERLCVVKSVWVVKVMTKSQTGKLRQQRTLVTADC